MSFIKLNNVDKTFFPNSVREHHALKNVSLDIKKGDFITVIGGNGAGKSTLLNAIAGSFSLDSGSIVINGVDVTKTVEHKRAKYISRVFQNPMQGTAPRMTVAENMALSYSRVGKKFFKFSLTKNRKTYFKEQLLTLNLGLEDRLDSEMGVLSGGQRQAISLLMATMQTPKLLLLDEHTAALDPKTQQIIMEITDKVVKEKEITTLMITHNINDALKYGNRLIVLNQGEIVKDIKNEDKEKLTAIDIFNMLDNF
ncbi:ATP-binding cassette domain-containing protein [Gemella sp. GH3]|uniref:ABC transporter ATP-binding protein n=1 Tax=unclassified Gemella TaxID=2624949 RepID=UPI0015D00F6E|nr:MULTISPECIES: ATP-binding cassette domain-containing protein [unclassified Gemella]MBF0714210.1 ATP-binding cassette domain-containing protein [Gemella sp. GH3.1]NYS51162.1 ATP-binding cassette domain-containing protein [Gemella sp. GH3]